MKIKLTELIPTKIISSRELVKEFSKKFSKLAKSKEIIIDFSNIEFISRSAAHEILKTKKTHNNMQFANMSTEVAEMIRIVAANTAYPRENTNNFKPQKTTLSSVLTH